MSGFDPTSLFTGIILGMVLGIASVIGFIALFASESEES